MYNLVCFVLFVGLVNSQLATLTLLTEAAEKDGAVCLDGSPPAYWLRPGTGTGAKKWLIFHEGGGWCVNLGDCYGRSNTDLGSSKGYSKTKDLGGGYFSNQQAVNPLMYNWNMVYFAYCDGGSFSGNNDTVSVVQGKNIYFRGYRNLVAYHADLSANHELMEGTDFVITGCSAGGLATYLHVDWWREQLPQTSVVKGMPDSGFFLDLNSPFPGGPTYSNDMRWVFETMNATSGVNKNCIAAHMVTKDTYMCFFAEHTAPYITTPIFPLQSQYDSWQTQFILGSNNGTDINSYGKKFVSIFQMAVLKNTKNGSFLDSCFHHCGAWDSIRISNTLAGDAVETWFEGMNQGVYFQNEPYPCGACCNPSFKHVS